MERNIAERTAEIETDTKNKINAVGKLGWFIAQDTNRNTHHHVKVSPRGL